MKKLYYLIVLVLILGLALTGCSLLSNVGQVPATGQKGMPLSTANLVALWHFDEVSGSITADSSLSGGNDGTVSGAILVDGKLGKALSFDGSDDYVDCGDSTDFEFSGDFSVEVWVKHSVSSNQVYVSKWTGAGSGSQWWLGFYNNKACFGVYTIESTPDWRLAWGTTDITDGEWHHVVGVRSGTDIHIYQDGAWKGSGAPDSINIAGNNAAPLTIGNFNGSSGSWCFNGDIDEVRIWDGALTADDILYSYADETLHVDDDWAQWPGAYYTINEALAVAVPDDTIIVEAGTYNERVIINKPLTLQGENRNTTIIDGTGMTADGIPAYGNNGILINPGSAYHMQDVGITISGFTVQNFEVIGVGGGAGIAADATYQYKNIIISDVIAKDNGLFGLYLPNVLNSNFSNIVVDNNDQIGNGQGYGIHCSVFSSSNTFTNIVAKNHDSTGIMVMQANNNIFDNIVSSNNKYGIYYFLGSSGNIVTCSTISDNTNNGIKLYACGNNEIHYSDIVGNINGGVDAVNIGTGVTFDATFNWWGDVSGPLHSTSWDWFGLTITNPDGLGDRVSDYVLYIPWQGIGGFVTGGGTIWSDAGYYRWDVDAEGQANFGFVSKYKKGKNVPDGSTNFVFQAGDLHFHSSSYDLLVVTGSDYAKFKGTGTINGSGEYKFIIWARDGGKVGDDTFRIKIWEEGEDSIEDVVYDNGTDQVIDSGSIIVHTK